MNSHTSTCTYAHIQVLAHTQFSQDDWALVSQPCVAWLARQQQGGTPKDQPHNTTADNGSNCSTTVGAASATPTGKGALPGALLEQLVDGLLPAVKAGEAQGTLHARKLSTALLYSGQLCTFVCVCLCMYVYVCVYSCERVYVCVRVHVCVRFVCVCACLYKIGVVTGLSGKLRWLYACWTLTLSVLCDPVSRQCLNVSWIGLIAAFTLYALKASVEQKRHAACKQALSLTRLVGKLIPDSQCG
jgi:hypothetical protein